MIYPTLPIHSAALSKLPQNIQKLLAQSGHTCAALDKVLVPATGPITIGPNATLTQQAIRSLPTFNGGKGSTKGLSPATKAILRSPNRMTPKKDPKPPTEQKGSNDLSAALKDEDGHGDEAPQDYDGEEDEEGSPVKVRTPMDDLGLDTSSDSDDAEDSPTDSDDDKPRTHSRHSKSTKAHLEDGLIIEQAAATVASLAARFPRFMDAIRKAHGLAAPGNPAELPALVLIAMASATRMHSEALDLLKAAAVNEASIGGQQGANLARILSKDAHIDRIISLYVPSSSRKKAKPSKLPQTRLLMNLHPSRSQHSSAPSRHSLSCWSDNTTPSQSQAPEWLS